MPKIKKKRTGFVLDMTPLVDIAFLLLTFFMFTAKFKSDTENEQKFAIERPKSSADTSKLPEQNLAMVKIAIDTVSNDTSYYYSISNEQVRQQVYSAIETIPADAKAMIAVSDLAMLDVLVRQTRMANFKTTFAIDADRKIRFKWIEDLMEVMRKNNATVFNFVTDKKGGGM